jgi:AcrR family transcriptional regulator
MSKMTPRAAEPQLRRTQRRGDRRREHLLRAAGELICRLDLSQITYAAVCGRAGVPPSSAYYFFPDLDALFGALIEIDHANMGESLTRPMTSSQRRTWQCVVECLVRRAARYKSTHPVGAKLSISGQTPPQLKRIDRNADKQLASLTLHLIEVYFVVPRIPQLRRIAFVATEIVDTVFTASVIEKGRITPTYVEFATQATVGLLEKYLGSALIPRGTASLSQVAKRRQDPHALR